jgi:hypothetical protein
LSGTNYLLSYASRMSKENHGDGYDKLGYAIGAHRE